MRPSLFYTKINLQTNKQTKIFIEHIFNIQINKFDTEFWRYPRQVVHLHTYSWGTEYFWYDQIVREADSIAYRTFLLKAKTNTNNAGKKWTHESLKCFLTDYVKIWHTENVYKKKYKKIAHVFPPTRYN